LQTSVSKKGTSNPVSHISTTMAILKLNKDVFKFEKAIVSDGIERVN
jgi:hypothetical protein